MPASGSQRRTDKLCTERRFCFRPTMLPSSALTTRVQPSLKANKDASLPRTTLLIPLSVGVVQCSAFRHSSGEDIDVHPHARSLFYDRVNTLAR